MFCYLKKRPGADPGYISLISKVKYVFPVTESSEVSSINLNPLLRRTYHSLPACIAAEILSSVNILSFPSKNFASFTGSIALMQPLGFAVSGCNRITRWICNIRFSNSCTLSYYPQILQDSHFSLFLAVSGIMRLLDHHHCLLNRDSQDLYVKKIS